MNSSKLTHNGSSEDSPDTNHQSVIVEALQFLYDIGTAGPWTATRWPIPAAYTCGFEFCLRRVQHRKTAASVAHIIAG
tara:strand:+ start:950 stop:1183 length:234 start_codon:yes stop_codon:yes gene_type:complete